MENFADYIYKIVPDAEGWRKLKSGKLVKLGTNVFIGENVKLGNNVSIEDDAEILNDSMIGDGSCVEKYTRFESSIAGKYVHVKRCVTIGANSFLNDRCIISDNATVGKSCRIKEKAFIGDSAIVGNGCTIGKSTSLFPNSEIGKCSEIGDFCIIGRSCLIGSYAFIDEHCAISANIGNYASVGKYAVMKSQYDHLTIEDIGSRKSSLTFWYNKKEDAYYVSTGCFRGTISEFLNKVNATYRETDSHSIAYLKAVAFAKSYLIPLSERESK